MQGTTRNKERNMKLLKLLSLIPLWMVLLTTNALAGDFDWVRGFNIQAEADPSGFRARMEARFQIGDVAIRTVISNCESPADAYILLRIGEICGQPMDIVTRQYEVRNGQGWGALAKSLGIKPGSREFHALKRGQDLYTAGHLPQGKGKGQGKLKHNGKNRPA
jgi:hypothetical protein